MTREEAPEKIYLQPSTIEQLPHQNIAYTKPLSDNSIEYTHTDTFIENAEKWLEENVMKYLITTIHAGMDVPDIKDEFFDDFKTYMKGE